MIAETTVLHEARPEILGATIAIEADGTFTETVAFTDEAAAREGEQTRMPRRDAATTLDAAMTHDVSSSTCTSPGSPVSPRGPRRRVDGAAGHHLTDRAVAGARHDGVGVGVRPARRRVQQAAGPAEDGDGQQRPEHGGRAAADQGPARAERLADPAHDRATRAGVPPMKIIM